MQRVSVSHTTTDETVRGDAIPSLWDVVIVQRQEGAAQFELSSVLDRLWSEKFSSLVIIASYFSVQIDSLSIHSLHSDFHYCIILKPSAPALVFPSWVFLGTQSKNNDVFCVCASISSFVFIFFRSICFVKVAMYLFLYFSQHTTDNLFN